MSKKMFLKGFPYRTAAQMLHDPKEVSHDDAGEFVTWAAGVNDYCFDLQRELREALKQLKITQAENGFLSIESED